MDIVVRAIILMGIIAFLVGMSLSWFNEIFKVKRDKKFDEIVELLGGANCGACGYPGCDAFAEAVLKGENPSKCTVAPPENIKKIGELVGLSVSAEKKKPVLLCVGGIGVEKIRAEYEGLSDCRAVPFAFNGEKACEFGCVGLGTCERACPFDAIKMVDGLPIFDYEKCTGCGICAEVCPRNVIAMVPWNESGLVKCNSPRKGIEVRNECGRGCIKCGICIKVCPEKAITWGDNKLPVVDMSKCTLCGLCVEKCPTKVMRIERGEVLLDLDVNPNLEVKV